jgi:HSP90 family molecular chaperone
MNQYDQSVEPSNQSQNTNESNQYQIDIDFHALIDLLSYHLYKDKSAVIRELLSNANDSLIARKRESGFGNEEPMIRLWLDPQAARLVVQDNGRGMSKEDLIEYLSTIGKSLTREKRRANQGEFDESIGQFGVGFLSSFIVAEKIVVETRRLEYPGFRWESQGKRDFAIFEQPDLGYGTTVLLDLKPEVKEEWNDEKIKKMVLENARNFVFPIYWGAKGEEKLNDLQAPWYKEGKPREEDIENYRSFLAQYDERFSSAIAALEIIPLHRDNIRGVIYVPPIATIPHERVGTVDLYCKRVFVAKDRSEIVPEGFGFIKGIVDCTEFQLNAARDDVLRDNYIFTSVSEFIGTQLLEHLRSLVKRAVKRLEQRDGNGTLDEAQHFNIRLQTFLDQYYLFIENALVQKRSKDQFYFGDFYLTDFEDFMPFQSSTHPSTTIPQYLARRKAIGRHNEIIVQRHDEDFATRRSISEHEGLEFILVRNQVEETYLKRYCQIIGVNCLSADEMLKDVFPVLEVSEGWEPIIRFYKEGLNHPEFSLSVYLSEFEPPSVAGRLLADKDSEGVRRLQEMVKEMEKNQVLDKDDPLYKELERVTQKSPHFLYINKRNPVLQRLAHMLEIGGNVDYEIILHSMFHDIAIATGRLVLESHLTEYQTRVYGEILAAVEAKSEVREAKGKLSETEKRYEEAQSQIKSLRLELDRIIPSSSTKTQIVSNEMFFIRPMKDNDREGDYIVKRTADICGRLGLKLIDPKQLKIPGDILREIIDYLSNSRFVIADVSEVDNPNIFYEVGYVYGSFPEKLILIADKKVIRDRKLPFDINTQRILGYDMFGPEFDKFIEELENVVKEMLEKNKD